ncbi:MAG: hypothetical protein Q9173_000341 [Seirophora scorigena]
MDSWLLQDSPLEPERDDMASFIESASVQSSAGENAPAWTQQSGDGTVSVNAVNASGELLPKTCFSPGSKDRLAPKKKSMGLPAVGLSRMATVQDACQDSPTIPGRPALLERRSRSVPAVVSLQSLSEEPNQSTPRASEFSKSAMKQSVEAVAQAARFEAKWSKRSSSLMARKLRPLVIPTNSPKNQTWEQSERLPAPETYIALPPRVPPKSPRTESRASPLTARYQHSAQSSVSTNCSSASFATVSSSATDRASPRLLSGLRRTDSPVSRLSPKTSVDNVSPESIWSQIFRLESPSRQKKGVDVAERQSPYRPEARSDPRATPLRHQRFTSEASAIPRGRNVSKGSVAFSNRSETSVRSPSSCIRDVDLPVGFKAAEAPRQVADLELRSLRQQADEQVSHFEILQAKDVTMLSKEIRQLDDRCEYLQRTYQALRQGRKSLHDRMMSYLRSPHMTNFSRESILKHEEALAEIDSSIDDWSRKSEQAENRRMRVRQKLLEHVAASLTLRPNGLASSQIKSEEQTPPESPEHDEGFCPSGRCDVQSIKIYANTGVAALLAEIEREIVSMEPERQGCW